MGNTDDHKQEGTLEVNNSCGTPMTTLTHTHKHTPTHTHTHTQTHTYCEASMENDLYSGGNDCFVFFLGQIFHGPFQTIFSNMNFMKVRWV